MSIKLLKKTLSVFIILFECVYRRRSSLCPQLFNCVIIVLSIYYSLKLYKIRTQIRLIITHMYQGEGAVNCFPDRLFQFDMLGLVLTVTCGVWVTWVLYTEVLHLQELEIYVFTWENGEVMIAIFLLTALQDKPLKGLDRKVPSFCQQKVST